MSDSKPAASHRRILAASLVGTAVEFYDLYIYATAASLVFGKLFFPAASASAQMMSAYATFALAFFARPLGAAVFGHFGDRLGRKSTLVASLMLMGGSTLAIAFLPTYAQAGWVLVHQGTDPNLVMAYLYKHTPLQQNVQVNLTCLVPTDNPEVQKPERLDLLRCIRYFLDFRFAVDHAAFRRGSQHHIRFDGACGINDHACPNAAVMPHAAPHYRAVGNTKFPISIARTDGSRDKVVISPS